MTAKIIRPLTGRIEIHGLRTHRGHEVPNKTMFKNAAGRGIRPTWEAAGKDQPYWKGYWTISRQHLTDVAEAIAIRDGQVLIEMHYSQTEKCDMRCRRAEGDECTCACEGKYHGNKQHASWLEVGETTLIHGSGPKIVNRILNGEQAEADSHARVLEMIRKMNGQ
uniref:hypothetical protein n=1 Tax=Arthrobacter sp. TaxID=1667 RepID=UPI00159EC061|nr:hypothetical protein [Arthrobacter sp.]